MKTFVWQLFLFLLYILCWFVGLALTVATFIAEGPVLVIAIGGGLFITGKVLEFIHEENWEYPNFEILRFNHLYSTKISINFKDK